MHWVYVLRSDDDKKFYIGYTANLDRRLAEHRRGVTHTTRRMKSPRIIFHEAFVSETDARRREKYFKTSKGRKALQLIMRDTLASLNYCPVV